MLHETLEPVPSLNQYAKCLWSIKRSFEPGSPSVEILPDSYRELVFSFGKPCVIVSKGNELTLPKVFGVNLLNKPLLVRAYGELHIVSIRLYPWATLELLKGVEPIIDLEQRFCDLHKKLSEQCLMETSTEMLKILNDDMSASLNLFETDRRLLMACIQIQFSQRAESSIFCNASISSIAYIC